MENASTSSDDFIASLGSIQGVSELRMKTTDTLIGCPVLVAENAFVFFAWDERNEQAGAQS